MTSPKTENAVREIPMTDEVIELFNMQKLYQKRMWIRNNINIDGYKDFIFTAKTGYPFTHEAIARVVKLIAKRASEVEAERALKEKREPVAVPEHTPHVWRHTFCTRLVENNVRYESIKIIMGHSDIRTSINIYTTISKELQAKAGEDLNRFISVL